MILGEQNHIVYALAMQATTASSTELFTRNIEMSAYENCTFLVMVGACTGAGTIFVERVPTSTGSSAAGTYIDGWHYRAITGPATQASTGLADTWGAVTAGTTAGFAFVTATSHYMYEIDVPAAALSTAQCCRLDILADSTGFQMGAFAILKPRYPQTTQISALGDYSTL